MVNTTLKVSKKTMDDLKKRKKHPRASYDEVIRDLLKNSEK